MQWRQCCTLQYAMTREHEAIDPLLLDVKWLRLFEQIHETRSVTRSAEVLGQSQPTVSIWLGKLRERLGDPLFVRTPGAMLPTPRADAMIGPVRELLQSLRALAEIAAPQAPFDPATSTRPWRICMTDPSHATRLPRLLATLRAQAPRAPVTAVRIDDETAAMRCSPARPTSPSATSPGSTPKLLPAGAVHAGLDLPRRAVATPASATGALTLRAYRRGRHVVTSPSPAPARPTWKPRWRAPASSGASCCRCRASWAWRPSCRGNSGPRSPRCRDTIGRKLLARNSAGLRRAGLPVSACPPFTVKQHWHARFPPGSGQPLAARAQTLAGAAAAARGSTRAPDHLAQHLDHVLQGGQQRRQRLVVRVALRLEGHADGTDAASLAIEQRGRDAAQAHVHVLLRQPVADWRGACATVARNWRRSVMVLAR